MADGFLGGVSDFAGGVGDFFMGGGKYADPKNINPSYGVPEADVRQAALSTLGNVGGILLGAGQSMTGAQRGQLLAQLGPALGGMGTDIYKSSQARLMSAQQQQAMREVEETNALSAEIQNLGPEGFKAKYKIDPSGIALKDLREALTKIKVTEATMSPADRAKAEARARALSYIPGQAAPSAMPQSPAMVGAPPAAVSGVVPDRGDTSAETYRRIASDPIIAAADPALAKQYADLADKLQSPGAKKTSELRAVAEFEKEQSLPRVEMSLASRDAKTDVVRNTIKQAIADTGYLTAGLGGATLGMVAGTPAFDLQEKISTIKANIGFDELAAMREASKTGGALGQIAVQELKYLQATLGSLERAQSPGELKKNLQQIDNILERYQKSRREAFKKDYGRYPEAPTLEAAAPAATAQPATRVRRFNPATGKIED